jgi:CRP/FNR family cyclic AMP-dependent transcriptional regulator
MEAEEAKKKAFREGQMSHRVHVVPRKKSRIMQTSMTAKTPYGLEVIESCLTCPLTTERLFCHLSKPALEGLDAISSSATYPKGAILFVEGQEPRGVFVLCNGRVKLSASSADGKALILRIAEAGEVVGLPGTISGKPYEATAEALEPIQANFVAREPFLQFLREHGEVALRVAEILSDIYHATYQEVRYLGLSGSAAGKLARFLLDRAEGGAAKQGEATGPIRAVLTLTHEEIAEMIGASRETVTRVFADFKRKKFVEVHGSTLIIRNKLGLQELIGA